jgi:hypothetical protein
VINFKGVFISMLLLLTAVMPAFAAAQEDQKPAKYILIHLDSVSSFYLISEIEAGNLPNIERVIREGGIIDRAVTYFPTKTPTVISSLRFATPIEESELVSWSGENRETGEFFTGPNTFREMMLSKSRISAINLLYGIPGFDRLSGIALRNLPDLLDEYRVLEFYWYAVDTYGHFFGEEKYLKKLRVFDKHFGRMMNHLDDDVNVIVYADHGMTFDTGVKTHIEIEDLIGNTMIAASYPNLYIDDPDKTSEIAKRIVDETNIDFTFYRNSDGMVTGYHRNGTVYIQREGTRLRYTYEGTDPFNYYGKGYDGSALSSREWLELTYDSQYPAVPINIYGFLSNPSSADIITLLDETKYSKSKYSRSGNHGGFTYRDVSVPIILKGPDVEFLYDRETIWLQNLFVEIDNVDFDYRPSRDSHYLSGWHKPDTNSNVTQLSFSPAYRWGIGSEITFTDQLSIDRYQVWGKYDLFRSYLARIWIGSGIDVADGDLKPMAFVRHEFRYRNLSARSTLSTAGNHRFALEYRIADPLSIQVVNFNSFGLRLHF